MQRVILHSDLNCFYASVECLHRPELRDKPVAVAGDAEARHGIILAKNEVAKAYKIKTGDAIWQAKQKCADLVCVPPNFPLYLRFSKMAKRIYSEYTDLIEPFGIDEAWLDVSGSVELFGDGLTIAREISQRMKSEIGLTVSIGVSWNKIFAKLGSDYKKPDAVTVFDQDNYRELVWPLPVEDLLYVGSATKKKLHDSGVFTIGDLAHTDPCYLRHKLGKMSEMLWSFANGFDQTPVAKAGKTAQVKSIGNSCTAPHDLQSDEDAKMLLFALCESVAMRLREQGLQGRTIAVTIRDSDLYSYERQAKMNKPTDITSEIMSATIDLFRASYKWGKPLRSLGVRITDLCVAGQPVQLDFYSNEKKREQIESLDKTVDKLRSRFGNKCVQRAMLLQDAQIGAIDAKKDHIIHPVGFLGGH